MDFIDKLTELANRIQRQKESVLTEEAAKTAFVLPFLQALGYDIFNPSEVVPELTADHGLKKGEKVDYAIKQEGRIIILIECKQVGAELESKHADQLFRYFMVTDARFGVLTDGIRYLFFSDLEKENCMDNRPFFEFNLSQFSESEVEELKKFTKTSFDLETIIGTASNLKYHRALLAEIKSEFENPSSDFVKLLTTRVYTGKFTQQVRERFTELAQKAMKDYIRDRVNERLNKALVDTDSNGESTLGKPPTEEPQNKQPTESVTNTPVESGGIETTAEELEGYRIIQEIGSELVEPSRIVMRDAKSYCAILMDDNNRRPICRLYFGKTKKSVSIFAPGNDTKETKIGLEEVSQLFQHRDLILAAITQYDKKK